MAYVSDIQNAPHGITDRFAALSSAELRDLGLCRAQIRSRVCDAH